MRRRQEWEIENKREWLMEERHNSAMWSGRPGIRGCCSSTSSSSCCFWRLEEEEEEESAMVDLCGRQLK